MIITAKQLICLCISVYIAELDNNMTTVRYSDCTRSCNDVTCSYDESLMICLNVETAQIQ
jgi:hypothetical protein